MALEEPDVRGGPKSPASPKLMPPKSWAAPVLKHPAIMPRQPAAVFKKFLITKAVTIKNGGIQCLCVAWRGALYKIRPW